MDRYAGKRFAGFIISCVCLMVGVAIAPVESFPALATTLGLLYGAYLAGQSSTDYKNIAMNGGKTP